MKIRIHADGHDMNLYFPNRVIFSRFAVRLITKRLDKKSADTVVSSLSPLLRADKLRALRLEVERMKAIHPDWVMVDVACEDGDAVCITM